jgi:hypothetical protein
MESNGTLDSTRHGMGNKTSYEEGKKEETRDRMGQRPVGGIYVHDVCDPQGRGLSPSLGCPLTLSPLQMASSCEPGDNEGSVLE